MTSAKSSDFFIPCHCPKSADFFSFRLLFGDPPPPTHCGRHIWKPPYKTAIYSDTLCSYIRHLLNYWHPESIIAVAQHLRRLGLALVLSLYLPARSCCTIRPSCQCPPLYSVALLCSTGCLNVSNKYPGIFCTNFIL